MTALPRAAPLQCMDVQPARSARSDCGGGDVARGLDLGSPRGPDPGAAGPANPAQVEPHVELCQTDRVLGRCGSALGPVR